ncbi:MAG TPA: methylaspartate mutase accessory protein GlmL [Dehalococcoidales bacterium]|nr:methylaspartate mutase accessory protein GlmL [Dehalococcoidales bacterium]
MDTNLRLLIDFGSTFTKVVAVDLRGPEIVAQTRVPSTVETDITLGLEQALAEIAVGVRIDNLDKQRALACSSAAGGLRMVCVGFVPEYTSQAGNLAALGAGARVIGKFSYELDATEIEEIEKLAPDIILLTGGTNGGNSKVILHNARLLAGTGPSVKFIIVAGNKSANAEIAQIIAKTGKQVVFTRNVMPEIGQLDLSPSNHEIRQLFLKNIIQAKGIARARAIIGDVIMPTPSAVLEAAKLMAGGYAELPGLGELLIVDTGGATTNVHSIARGEPQRADVVKAGLPEPYEKRTVEGDLGLKYNLDVLVDLLRGHTTHPDFPAIIERFKSGQLPLTEEEMTCHTILAALVVRTAVTRHAGTVEEMYGPSGRYFIQRGKDLTGIRTVIGTGGALVFAGNPRELLKQALFEPNNPSSLKPVNPQFRVDERYILYAVGLLAQNEPQKAFELAGKYLKILENSGGDKVGC